MIVDRILRSFLTIAGLPRLATTKRMTSERTLTNRLDILYVGFFLCVGGFVVCGIYALVGITIALQLPDWTLSLTVTR